jgi:hypothetical protein
MLFPVRIELPIPTPGCVNGKLPAVHFPGTNEAGPA